MNYFYRKVPVVIEAFQITKETRQDNKDWPNWLNEAWNKDPDNDIGAVFPEDYPNSKGDDRLMINTLEGTMHVTWGSWIIKGVQGELYACIDEVFQETYEAVSDYNA